MRPPPIYSQFPHFHIYGVATSILSKEKFEVCFLLKYFQNHKIKRRSWKKRERKRKGIEKKRERKEL
jgi:hypothetical protein